MRVTTTGTDRASTRQDQIIEATVEVLARQGYSGTSFARIVEHAGMTSTRLVSYHFASKDALLRATLAHLVEEATTVMAPLIDAETTARGRLAAYVRGNLAFLRDRPDHARAAVEIVGHLTERHEPESEVPAGEMSVALLEAALRRRRSGSAGGRRTDPSAGTCAPSAS